MLATITENAALVRLGLSAVTVLIWIAYLQLLLTSLRHQRRPVVLINTGAGRGVRQRCFLSNLGMEPIYLMDVAIRIEAGDRVAVAAITDRDPQADGEASQAEQATNQGPLDSGAMCDLGCFETLIRRALDTVGGVELEDVTRLDLVAVFAVAAQDRIYASKRGFFIGAGDPPDLVPDAIRARQITGWWRRRRLAQWLEARRQGQHDAGLLP